MQIFLMDRYDWENSHYKTLPWAVPIDCCHCGSSKCGTEPPYHPHVPTTWRCYDCRGQFSVHRDPNANAHVGWRKVMVGNHTGGEEERLQESIAAWREEYDRKAHARMVEGYNILRSALAWYDAHEVEKKLDHLPQWVTMGRDLLARS